MIGHPAGRRRRLPFGALAVGALCLVALAGCRDEPAAIRRSVATRVRTATVTAPADATLEPAATTQYPDPGSGVAVGRLVDAVTGMPVADAGVSLLELGRRTVTGIDGGFRFDGVPAGAVTIVFGPVAGYVPHSTAVRLPDGGIDLGIVPMQATSPPTLIVPDQGGTVSGLCPTRVEFPVGSLAEPTTVGVTCVEREQSLSAEAPPGRLPLAAVHITPAEAKLGTAATLIAALPSQPRYAAGVTLDLLRLDLDRLIWVPTSTVVVAADGLTARGNLTALGTYLVAAPPFGTFADRTDGTPAVTRLNVTGTADGPPSDVFLAGTPIVYLSLDYAQMANTPMLVRTADRRGTLLFELERPYTGMGRDNVPMTTASGRWPAGAYVTTVYLGDPPAARSSIAWRVTSGATPAPPRATLPPRVPLPPTAVPVRPGPLPPPTSTVCRIPAGWYAYVVRPGDTLYSIGRLTGTTVASLTAANCLRSTTIYAGQVLYVPRPPMRPAAPTTATYPNPTRPPPWPPLTATWGAPAPATAPITPGPPNGAPTAQLRPTAEPPAAAPPPASPPLPGWPSAVPSAIPSAVLPTSAAQPTSAEVSTAVPTPDAALPTPPAPPTAVLPTSTPLGTGDSPPPSRPT